MCNTTAPGVQRTVTSENIESIAKCEGGASSFVPSQHFSADNKDTIAFSTIAYMASKHLLVGYRCIDAPGETASGAMKVGFDRRHRLEEIRGKPHADIKHTEARHSAWLGQRLLVATVGQNS